MPFPSESDGVRDPAFQPLVEAGEGEAEGFEVAERQLIEHASHGDDHGTGIIAQHASRVDEEDAGSVYGEADDEQWDDVDDDEEPDDEDDDLEFDGEDEDDKA